MNVSQSAKEWASVGTGALVSGALVVVIAQMGVVRMRTSPADFERVQPETELAAGAEDEHEQLRSRLSLPKREQESIESLLAFETTEDAAEEAPETSEPAKRVERLESHGGKDEIGGKARMAGAMQRLAAERTVDKAAQAEAAPQLMGDLAQASGSQASGNQPELKAPMTSINPKYRTQTSTVNAGFDAPDARSAGEELSWDVHEVFQSEGPRPFFYVDEYTGTLMFGLGWQH